MDDFWVGHRRQFLATAAMLAIPRRTWADDESEQEIAAVKQIAHKSGINGLHVSKNDQYLAIGDAPDEFRNQALKILESLLVDYLKHFKDKGFQVSKPTKRLTVVMFADKVEFAAYLSQAPGDAAGIYEVETNRLLMFDNREGAARASAVAQKVNTFVLFHEATHQLTFNTGLLERDADIPLAISEGLATYSETRHLKGPGKIGDVNFERKKVLLPTGARKHKVELVPLADFLVNEDRFNDRAHFQVAYAQAWLLIHFLMKTPERTAKFQTYLTAIRARRKPDHRMEDWQAAFGDPAEMDRELLAYLKKPGS